MHILSKTIKFSSSHLHYNVNRHGMQGNFMQKLQNCMKLPHIHVGLYFNEMRKVNCFIPENILINPGKKNRLACLHQPASNWAVHYQGVASNLEESNATSLYNGVILLLHQDPFHPLPCANYEWFLEL